MNKTMHVMSRYEDVDIVDISTRTPDGGGGAGLRQSAGQRGGAGGVALAGAALPGAARPPAWHVEV